LIVVFVSQCEKRALNRTRRVLDAFSDRIGDNTWQTVITEEGLKAVKRLIGQTASKSTAVSCHWIRSRTRTQLKWIVGNKNKFNNRGVVPVNSTMKKFQSKDKQPDWVYLPVIKCLTALAALLHDWGKASLLFQNKLNPNVKGTPIGDPLRHEFISCMIFKALISSTNSFSNDNLWITALSKGDISEERLRLFVNNEQVSPLKDLPDVAALISWLIISHHRLPLPKDKQQCDNLQGLENDSIQSLLNRVTKEWGYENRFDEQQYQKMLSQCFEFPLGLLSSSAAWVTKLQYWASQLLQVLPSVDMAMKDGSWRVILHHSRLCLMLGDHFYSSQGKDADWPTQIDLFANTEYHKGSVQLKQRLDEHLVRVSEAAVKNVKYLPSFESEPYIATDLDELKPKENTPDKFKWQDKAMAGIHKWQDTRHQLDCGFFAVNMASTGCGKTIANAKVMQAASGGDEGLRFILALGLRTLTLQTGDEYRERLKMDKSQLAVLIGSRAIAELHSGAIESKEDREHHQKYGSESVEPLQDDSDMLQWEGVLPEYDLTTVISSDKDRRLLYAPILACTVDHIMAATETKRGGRFILPTLRLMSSDLVIDEIDDFSGEDLVAIGRLIHLAGMLGRKVMISSATIPPDIAIGYFHTYQSGWTLFANSRKQSQDVGCAWIDEFTTNVTTVSNSHDSMYQYQLLHQRFVDKRVKKLNALPAKRKAAIYPCNSDPDSSKQGQYFRQIQAAIVEKHLANHVVDARSGKMVSFGVVRVANIQPCIALTEYLLDAHWPSDIEARCMAYHSQQVLLLRHEQELYLDKVLKRKEGPGEQPIAFNDKVIRSHIDKSDSQHVIFVLVATPVEEVGRDHDFDWAVVEPSSYRSIIQLAGRVRRHRDEAVEQPNIALMQYNWKGFQGRSKRVFLRPGYETDAQTELSSHDLSQLVEEKALREAVTAIPRITKSEILRPKDNLADLEHFSIARTLGTKHLIKSQNQGQPSRRRRQAEVAGCCSQLLGYVIDNWWMTGLPQHFNQFRRSEPSAKLHLLCEDNDSLEFKEYDEESGWCPVEVMLDIEHISLTTNQEKNLWYKRDYSELLTQYALGGQSIYRTSMKYGEISFVDWNSNHGYQYNDQMGLTKKIKEGNND
jgi:CRISPR-associated endonuclease/helicase Cas3